MFRGASPGRLGGLNLEYFGGGDWRVYHLVAAGLHEDWQKRLSLFGSDRLFFLRTMTINVTKIALYVVLLGLILFCGKRFLDRYSAVMSTEVSSDPYAMAEIVQPVPAATIPDTDTNTVGVTDSGVDAAGGKGGPDAVSSQPGTGVPEATNLEGGSVTVRPETMTKRSMDRGTSADASGIGFYIVALFGLILGIAALAAHDISSFFGRSTHKLLHNEEGEGVHSAAYDAAEELWANGQHLDAIRMMRDYLQKNPREVHVMVRIAEIYEKDLRNFLAAALEYEELLTKKLPKERWAWSAIHLVNLYFGKLDKPKQAIELLYRIHREYGHTAAAEKARKRLLQLDPGFQSELDLWEASQADEHVDEFEEESVDEEPSSTATSTIDESESPLPKGFRIKK